MILFDNNDLATAEYDEGNEIIVFRTNSILANKNTNLIENLLVSALKIAEDKSIKGEIVDIRQLRGNFTKVIDYLSKTYYPRMHELGMKKAAYIVSTDHLGQNLVEKIATETTTVEVMAFTEFKDAEKWVTS